MSRLRLPKKDGAGMKPPFVIILMFPLPLVPLVLVGPKNVNDGIPKFVLGTDGAGANPDGENGIVPKLVIILVPLVLPLPVDGLKNPDGESGTVPKLVIILVPLVPPCVLLVPLVDGLNGTVPKFVIILVPLVRPLVPLVDGLNGIVPKFVIILVPLVRPLVPLVDGLKNDGG